MGLAVRTDISTQVHVHNNHYDEAYQYSEATWEGNGVDYFYKNSATKVNNIISYGLIKVIFLIILFMYILSIARSHGL